MKEEKNHPTKQNNDNKKQNEITTKLQELINLLGENQKQNQKQHILTLTGTLAFASLAIALTYHTLEVPILFRIYLICAVILASIFFIIAGK